MRKFALLFPLLLVLAAVPSKAQSYSQTPVTVSHDKVRGSDGKVYYSHVVREKQTLFSIAKAYGVTVDDIYNANKDLDIKKNGLKKGDIINIPISSDIAQTSEAIAKDSTVAPQKSETKAVQSVAKRTHTVKWYEDIDDIAKKYDVSVTDLMKVNNLKSRKLKKRMVLVIPDSGVSQAESESTASEEKEASERPAQERTDSSFFDQIFGRLSRKDQAEIALLLPFDASGKGSSINMDFYCGFLLALRDLGKQGSGAKLDVYDVAGGQIPLTGSEIGKYDMLIGPVSVGNLNKALALDSGNIPIVSPLDQKAESLALANQLIIQSPTPYDVQYDDIARWIKSDRNFGDKVIVISEEGGSEIPQKISEIFSSEGLSYTPYSYNILQGRNAIESLEGISTSTGCNRIVIASENQAFVNDAVRNLNQLAFKKYQIVLYSSSKIRSFDTIDVETLHTLGLRCSLSYYIDYEQPKVREFLMEYRALFGTEPTQFAFSGYDIATFFVQACDSYGSRWFDRLGEMEEKDLLQSSFRFKRADGGGYINQGIRRIVYEPDYTIRLENRLASF